MADNLRVKEVAVAPGGDGDQGARAQRFVICHNPEQAARDTQVRTNLVTHLETLIAGSDTWTPRRRDELVGSLSLQPRRLPEVPADTAGAAFPRGSLAVRIRDELGEVWSDQRFQGLFGVRGKLGISPAQLMIVLVLAMAENLADRQAADMVRRAIDWKYALGLALEDPGFDLSVLSEFRARLGAGSMETEALDALLIRLAGPGLVRSGGRQRTTPPMCVAATSASSGRVRGSRCRGRRPGPQGPTRRAPSLRALAPGQAGDALTV